MPICRATRTAPSAATCSPMALSANRARSPIIVGGEGVETIPGTLIASSQPQPCPFGMLARVIRVNASTITRVPTATRQAACQSRNHQPEAGRSTGQANSATGTIARMPGILIAPAAATSTQPSRKRRRTAACNASATKPIITASLCAPPTRCAITSGLTSPNQSAERGSTPSRRASDGTVSAAARMPAIASSRIPSAEDQ